MNFFRSEEHLRGWEGNRKKMEGGKISLDALIQLFGQPYFTQRGAADYISNFSDYMADLVDEVARLPDPGKYWKLSPVVKTGFKLAHKAGLI